MRVIQLLMPINPKPDNERGGILNETIKAGGEVDWHTLNNESNKDSNQQHKNSQDEQRGKVKDNKVNWRLSGIWKTKGSKRNNEIDKSQEMNSQLMCAPLSWDFQSGINALTSNNSFPVCSNH
jgi:hypothetical protein